MKTLVTLSVAAVVVVGSLQARGDVSMGGLHGSPPATIVLPMENALRGSTRTIHVPAGGAQRMFLDAGPDHAGELYWIIGSASGAAPGYLADGYLVPLNQDAYTFQTVFRPNAQLKNQVGTLERSSVQCVGGGGRVGPGSPARSCRRGDAVSSRGCGFGVCGLGKGVFIPSP